MKIKDKYYLKALLLASISSIGLPVAQASGMSGTIARKEREGSDASTEMVSEVLSSGVLESNPSFGEVLGHTSHSSHSSHGSHGSHTSSTHGSHSSHTSSSHTSHVSSGYDGGTTSHSSNNNEVKGLLIGTGAVLVGVGIYALIKHIIKTHKNHVDARIVEMSRYSYASRDLSSGMYGKDVDRMTEYLIENDVIDRSERSFSHKWLHYKYNSKVKRSVKRIQARMGRQSTGKASTTFLMNLQQWKNTRQRLVTAATKDSLDIKEDRNALLAVAILLVEKGYLKSYDADNITSEQEKSKIVKAYYAFLRGNQLTESSLVDEQRLRLLNSLPNNQK